MHYHYLTAILIWSSLQRYFNFFFNFIHIRYYPWFKHTFYYNVTMITATNRTLQSINSHKIFPIEYRQFYIHLYACSRWVKVSTLTIN